MDFPLFPREVLGGVSDLEGMSRRGILQVPLARDRAGPCGEAQLGMQLWLPLCPRVLPRPQVTVKGPGTLHALGCGNT